MWITREKRRKQLSPTPAQETRAKHDTSEHGYGQNKCVVKYIFGDKEERQSVGQKDIEKGFGRTLIA
jgi:hypothetical protein